MDVAIAAVEQLGAGPVLVERTLSPSCVGGSSIS
jgi:hypothetical protein